MSKSGAAGRPDAFAILSTKPLSVAETIRRSRIERGLDPEPPPRRKQRNPRPSRARPAAVPAPPDSEAVPSPTPPDSERHPSGFRNAPTPPDSEGVTELRAVRAGFTRISNEIFDRIMPSLEKPGEQVVLWRLIRLSIGFGDSLRCTVSLGKLAERTNVRPTALREHLRVLEARGLVRRLGESKRGIEFELSLPRAGDALRNPEGSEIRSQ